METVLSSLFKSDHSPKHHAFLLAGEAGAVVPIVRQFLINELQVPAGEVEERVFDRLTVDDSRELKRLLGAPVSGAHRYIICGFNDLTPEAAQALLKVLEEPPAGFIFFIITREPLLLPATILSRVWLAGGEEGSSKIKFFTLSPAERLAVITKTLTKLDEEDESARNYALNVLNSVEQELAAELNRQSDHARLATAATVLQESRAALQGVRLSVKLVLERLALGLPTL